jgi:hypothetical protein
LELKSHCRIPQTPKTLDPAPIDTRFLMRRETHRHMFLFATSFSWWLEDLQITLSRLQPGF